VKSFFIALSIFVFVNVNTFGQVDSLSNIILNNIDSLRFAEIEGRTFKIMPYVAPTYTPETQWMLSGGGLITFKTQNKDRLLNLSSIPFSVGYSSNGSFSVRAMNVIYWKGDQIRSFGEFQWRDMPDNYWGVGYDKGDTVLKSDTTTAYSRSYWRFFQRLMFRTSKSFFVGLVVDLNQTRAFNMNPLMEVDEDVLMSGTNVFNTGLGFVLDYDTRDFVQNAYEGMYLSAGFTSYNPFWGGNSKFNIIDLDFSVAVDETFFVGYELDYTTPVDSFAVAHLPLEADMGWDNSAFMHYQDEWYSYSNIFEGNPNTSLAIKALVGYDAGATGIEDGLTDKTVEKLLIYPNPMMDKTNVKFPNQTNQKYRLVVVDASGRVVRIIENITNDNVIINRDQLKPGIHIINLSGEKIYKGKLLVK